MGVMSKLTRSASGIFTLENGVSVEEFKGSSNPEKYLISPDLAIDFPKVVLTNNQATRILNGLFDRYDLQDALYRVYNENEFWGVGSSKEGVLKIDAYVR
jgi:tRNA U55 pseudouridine synthase TruB